MTKHKTSRIRIYLAILTLFLVSVNVSQIGLMNHSRASASIGPISVVGVSWISGSVQPGEANEQLNVTIQNLNSFSITGVSEELNLTNSPLTNATGGIMATTYVPTPIPSGYAISTIFTLNIASNVTTVYPTPVHALLTVNYLNGADAPVSQTFSVSIFITAGAAQITITPLATNVQLGGTSTVSFLIGNSGKLPAISSTVFLKVVSGLIVLGNLSVSSIGTTINPGQNFVYNLNVTTGPGLGAGSYPGTLVVKYSDEFGVSHTTSLSVAINVLGLVNLVVQSQSITQNQDNLTVSGQVVNYGNTPADFVEITGTLNSSADGLLGTGTSFVGTIAPRSPAFFNFVIPYPSQTSALSTNVTFSFGYQINGKLGGSSSNPTPFTLLPASQLPQHPSQDLTHIIEGILIAVIIIVPIISFLYIRRTRR